MAFVTETLQLALYSVFNSMKDGNVTTFSNGISNAIVTFVSTGSVTTVDSGTVTGGTFGGSGRGVLSVTATSCASIIKSACDTMKDMSSGGDDYFAQKLGEGVKKIAEEGTVTTTVTGVLTPPPPATPITPYGGRASGSISCSEISLVTALKELFKEMYNKKDDKTYDGNLEFAKKLATEINSFWASGTISTEGSGNIEGSEGSGSIS